MIAPKPGMVFRHDSLLEPDWRPDIKAGEKYADAPKALCRVTSVAKDAVYYAYADAPGGGVFILSLAKRWPSMTVVDESVGE